ncbi:MAG: hypothetical protein KKE51_01935 [Gammaproteobacteria bacterium]|nr:hypothetical protein [Gammaproteobacteria bacterium]MBU1600752.1 hypothetical protein [Gammaproteobacteria bacterium]MBU2435208.1 hypothetical protein [Gammaproteobacteria bacterium]
MSGFEHYDRELRDLDNEIHRYAALCGVNLANRHEVDACLRNHHAGWADDKARESLHGLLILRIKLEAEMIALGFSPPPLVRPAAGQST